MTSYMEEGNAQLQIQRQYPISVEQMSLGKNVESSEKGMSYDDLTLCVCVF